MAELLVIVRSKINTKDALQNASAWKRGDVVESRPDGWAWGTGELVSELFRIIRIPGLIVSKQEALLATPSGGVLGDVRRLRMLNFDSAVGELADLFDPPRQGPYIDAPDIETKIDAITVLK